MYNKKSVGHAYTLVLLLCCQTLWAQTVYSLILNSPDTDAAVVVGDRVYKLIPSKKSSIVLQTKAPTGKPYFYVKLKKGTMDIIDQETYMRPAETRKKTYNEFYNRLVTVRDMTRFDILDEFTPQFNRAPDKDLHPLGEIATVHVVADQELIDSVHDRFLDDYKVKVNVTFITSTKVKNFADCDFGVIGRTSRFFNKLPYKIVLPEGEKGLNGFRHLRFRTTENEPSYIRDYMATELLRATNQPGSITSYVRLFLNNRAIGLFPMVEKYDDTWLEREFNPDKDEPYAYGYLYEGDGGKSQKNRADLSYLPVADFNTSAYIIEETPKGQESSFQPLHEFTAFISHQRNAAEQYNGDIAIRRRVIDEWHKYFGVEGFLANMALEFLIGSADGYLQNTNNYHLYEDPIQNKLIYIAWDFDYTFANGPYDTAKVVEGRYEHYGWLDKLPLTTALLIVPEYRLLFERQVSLIASQLLSPTYSFPVIDSVVELIREDVVWDQTLPRVRTGPSYISGGLEGFIEGKIDANGILPYAFDLPLAIDFVIRVNKNIDLDKAIEGPTGHPSVLGIKEFIQRKLSNYLASLES
ncbi:coth protein-domain-containing protein [Sporodiniella umbellata]|nr:coth protein-domain-containing protein [Sporodiniella umbellata]